MFSSFNHFAKLCVFRGNPADINGSTPTLVFLFLILVVLFSSLAWVLVSLLASDSSSGAQTSRDVVVQVLDTICTQLFIALCIYVVLHVRRVPQNFQQTFSSYLGVSVMITLVSLALIVGVVLIGSRQELGELFAAQESSLLTNRATLLFVSLTYMVSLVWTILALAYILNKSMDVKFWHCGVLAVMMMYTPEALEIFPNLLKFAVYAIGSVFGLNLL
ncbi:MAG: hypothetical protein F4W92_08600 [Gammaproteobacteria bacterium]|nr:hypothetical protein [Gammaproteobacteria bacterium]